MAKSAEDIQADLKAAEADGDAVHASEVLVEHDGEEINFLDLPDDELDGFFQKELDSKAVASTDDSSDGDADEKDDKDGESGDADKDADDDADEGEDDGSDDKTEDDPDPDPDADKTADGDADDAAKSDKDDDKDNKDAGEQSPDAKKTDDDKEDDEDVVINALADLERILSPFTANGRQVQVDSVEDALTLMQMGANYNKKMAALKPSLKFVKMLEQNDLLDESRLTQLIDISKKNPEAIGKFLKDNKIDPNLVTADEAGDNYTPGKYEVNDSEVELDQVLDSIRGNESFSKTIDVVSNQWDQKSKEAIFNDPNIIAVIDSHIQSGVFDKISKRMETEKMLGKLKGISDIAAYKQIGDALDAAGLLNAPQKSNAESKTETTKPAKVVDKARNDKRRAAAATKQTVSKKKPNLNDLNPLSMSDEDFEKATENIFI